MATEQNIQEEKNNKTTLRVLKFMGSKVASSQLCLALSLFPFFYFALRRPKMFLMVFHTFNQFKFILNSQLTKQYNFH